MRDGGTIPSYGNYERCQNCGGNLHTCDCVGKVRVSEDVCPVGKAKEYRPETDKLSLKNAGQKEDGPEATAPEIEIHHEIAEEIAYLLDRKRAAYGTENIRQFGEFGVLVRVSDKVERLKNLHKKGLTAMTDETRIDTWRDIAGYAILALMLEREAE